MTLASTTQPKIQQPSWQKARLAVLATFFVNGSLFANWVSRIPEIQQIYSLSEGELGIVLVGISFGVISALLLVGNLIATYTSRRVTWFATILYLSIFPLMALMPSAIFLWAGLFFWGGVMSSMDVAMNAQAVEVELISKKTLMSSFHASWSIGGVFGAIMGALALRLGLSIFTHFVLASALFALLMLFAQRYLIPQDTRGEEEESGGTFRLPSKALLPIGVVALASAVAEGAMADWSGVYMTKIVQADASIVPLAYGAFALMMTVGRLSGDKLTQYFRPSLMVRVSGALALFGLLLLIAFPQTITGLIGFGIVGAGLAVTIPLAFSAAGRLPDVPAGVGIAGVATIGYGGFLAGPPLIGLIAEATSLQVSFALVALMVGTLMFTGGALDRAQKQKSSETV
jgi:predicted MFS family arabinose efflux permease